MQQVLNLLFLNHRKSLHYPENTIPLRSGQLHEGVMASARRNYQLSNAINPTQSIQLKPNKNHNDNIDSFATKSITFAPYRLSHDEKVIMKKYNKDCSPYDKLKERESVELPLIAREPSTRGKSLESTSRGDDRKLLTWQRKRQRFAKIRRALNKMRKIRWAIAFIVRARNAVKRGNHLFQQLSEIADKMGKAIQSTINKYYKSIMSKQLQQMGNIIKRKTKDANYKATPDIVTNLLDISECLKRSSLKPQLFRFLILISLENITLPHDFFCEFELKRLSFLPRRFRISKINDEQITMIVGMFLGVKLFAMRILAEPWAVQYIPMPKKIDKFGAKVVWAYSSYFYHVFLKMFNNIPQNSTDIRQLMRKGVVVFELKAEDDEFYKKVETNFPEEHKQITRNLSSWINRISLEVIKQRK